MNIFDSILRLGGKQAAGLASEVAQQSCAAVWDRVQATVLGMSPAEAKGYIRAHATETVMGKIDAGLLRKRAISASARAEIVTMAADGVVEKLLNEVVRLQRTTRRRAA